MKDPNKATGEDYLYTAIKAGFGALPIVGSFAAEFMGSILVPPLEKRRVEWMDSVGRRLKKLEDDGLITIEGLQNNEQFIDTVLTATSLAIKTSEKEKIEAFRNAVINTATGEAPDKTKTQMFLNLLDGFTLWHIKILHLFDNPKEWFLKSNTRPASLVGGSLMSVVKQAFPELKNENELLDRIWVDLQRAGLHNTGALGTMMTGSGLLQERTTEFGKLFLKFIWAAS
jgi:DNA-binding Lrp family transcriptional regulator